MTDKAGDMPETMAQQLWRVEAELAAERAKVVTLQSLLDDYMDASGQARNDLADKWVAEQAQVRRLEDQVKLLTRYVRHPMECFRNSPDDDGCVCGLTKVLATEPKGEKAV